MSTETLPPTPKSPGISVGARRKGPKELPKLPLSAFSPPNTGTSDRFPLAPSPSTLQPEDIIDAHVIAPNGDLANWQSQVGQSFGGKTRGVVLSLHGVPQAEVEKVVKEIQSSASSSSTPVLAIAVPFVLEDGAPASPPSYLANASSSKPAIVLSTTFKESSPAAIEALTWASTQGLVVNIDVQSDLQQESGWDSLEELLTKATSPEAKGKIILFYVDGSYGGTVGFRKDPALVGAVTTRTEAVNLFANILPPPDSLALPIVKLLTHPVYRSYQGRTASLSLFAHLYVNFLPPAWGAPTPPTPPPAAPAEDDAREEEERDKASGLESKEAKEWKRRIKMYIGPAVEAFGFQRILFGSSPAAPLTSVSPVSRAGDWFELARESFAELGVEQDAIDAVFSENAKQVYGESS
ncbi:hypothetical protein C8Q79DRAFT_1011451 [Trametes meyenii]|nr:hypothetical protein C8Q79DRAFT_1011451 [Trametes meyenii]